MQSKFFISYPIIIIFIFLSYIISHVLTIYFSNRYIILHLLTYLIISSANKIQDFFSKIYFNYDIRLYFLNLKFWLLSITFLFYNDTMRLCTYFLHRFPNSSIKRIYLWQETFPEEIFFHGENEFYKITERKREKKERIWVSFEKVCNKLVFFTICQGKATIVRQKFDKPLLTEERNLYTEYCTFLKILQESMQSIQFFSELPSKTTSSNQI